MKSIPALIPLLALIFTLAGCFPGSEPIISDSIGDKIDFSLSFDSKGTDPTAPEEFICVDSQFTLFAVTTQADKIDSFAVSVKDSAGKSLSLKLPGTDTSALCIGSFKIPAAAVLNVQIIAVPKNSSDKPDTVSFKISAGIKPTLLDTAARKINIPQSGTASITAKATGTALTYQWSLNNLPLTGKTDSVLTVSAAGEYQCEISNKWGSVKTKPVTVSVVNNAVPVWKTPLTDTVSVGASKTIDLSKLCSDPENAALTFAADPKNQLVCSTAGNLLTFTGGTSTGTFTLTVTASDAFFTVPAQIIVTVIPKVNSAPVWKSTGTFTIPPLKPGELLSYSFKDLVSDPDGESLSFILTGAPEILSLSGDKIVSSAGFTAAGTFTFTITAKDSSYSVPAQFSLLVTDANRAPVWKSLDTVAVKQTKSAVINLDTIVSDPEKDPLTYVVNGTKPAFASLAGSLLTIAPQAADTSCTITITASDTAKNSAPKSIRLAVRPLNEAPVITGNKPMTISENGSVVLTADSLIFTDDGKGPYILTIDAGANYAVTGTNTVAPNKGFFGELAVPVSLKDETGLTSAKFTVKITVNHVVETIVLASSKTIKTAEDTPVAITLDSLTVTGGKAPYTITAESGTSYTAAGAVITPAKDFSGTLTVPVTVTDVNGFVSNKVSVSVAVSAVNDAPVIKANAGVSTDEDIALTITPAMFTIADADSEKVFTLAAAAGTNYTVNGLQIIPAANFNGELQVPVTAKDALVSSAPCTLKVTVKPVNDAPVVTKLPTTKTGRLGTIISESMSIADADNDPISVSVLSPAGAKASYQNGTISLTLDPAVFKTTGGKETIKLQYTDNVISNVINWDITIENWNIWENITLAGVTKSYSYHYLAAPDKNTLYSFQSEGNQLYTVKKFIDGGKTAANKSFTITRGGNQYYGHVPTGLIVNGSKVYFSIYRGGAITLAVECLTLDTSLANIGPNYLAEDRINNVNYGKLTADGSSGYSLLHSQNDNAVSVNNGTVISMFSGIIPVKHAATSKDRTLQVAITDSGEIYRRIGSGVWSIANPARQACPLSMSLASSDGNTAYIVNGDSILQRSTTMLSSASFSTVNSTLKFEHVAMLSPTDGWAVTSTGLIIGTRDGFATYSYSTLPGASMGKIKKLFVSEDKNAVYAIDESGGIYRWWW